MGEISTSNFVRQKGMPIYRQDGHMDFSVQQKSNISNLVLSSVFPLSLSLYLLCPTGKQHFNGINCNDDIDDDNGKSGQRLRVWLGWHLAHVERKFRFVRIRHDFRTSEMGKTGGQDDHDRFGYVMELFSRRRWTTGLAQQSNMYRIIACMRCIIFWGLT